MCPCIHTHLVRFQSIPHVEVITSKVRKARKVIGEVDEVAVELAADEGARNVYPDMLKRFELEDGVIVKKAGAKNALDPANTFRNFVVTIGVDRSEELGYIDEKQHDQRFEQVLQGLENISLEQFYSRAGRASRQYHQ